MEQNIREENAFVKSVKEKEDEIKNQEWFKLMRIFKAVAPYEYREQQVIEIITNKEFTLTQRHEIFNEDYYSLSRFIACENVSAYETPENNFYVYYFTYIDNYRLHELYIDEKTTFKIVKDNLISFMEGSFDTKRIKNYIGELL